MIDPATINPIALPSVPLEDRLQLPTKPCICFAIDSQVDAAREHLRQTLGQKLAQEVA